MSARPLGCLVCLMLLLSLPCQGYAAGPYRVKANATGAHDGSSWGNAFTDLQAALAVVHSGEEIWVAAGTYKPTTGTDRTKSFKLIAGSGLYGGFAGTETLREQRNAQAHATILSGDIGTVGNSSDNSNSVVVGANNAVLDGFVITGGSGGTSGGGLVSKSVSPIISNCTFTGNSSASGGGMYNYAGSPTVSNCIFSGNTGNGGGGIYNKSGALTVTNCTFSGNSTSSSGGGGIYNASTLLMFNCTITGNVAAGYGGGLCNVSGASITTVTNCIMWGNSAQLGPEVYKSVGKPYFIHCDIKDSGGSGAQWDPELGIDGGGNIMANPQYVDAAHPAGTDGSWRTADDGLALTADSPCIDAGDPAGAPAYDILGRSRGVKPDIGAYEYLNTTPMGAPQGGLEVTYHIKTPSTSPDGAAVRYTYTWSSDKGDLVTHGPTLATSDTLTEMNLVQDGETWTVHVTPSSGSITGPAAVASVKFIDLHSGVMIWSFYR